MNKRRRKKLQRRLLDAVLAPDPVRLAALLRAGADPGQADRDGTTPLYLASVQGESESVRLLLAAGARPDAESAGPGAEGTPLCAAASWGHTGTVRVLLEHGADPRLREDRGTGYTALEWAKREGHRETAALLTAAERNLADTL